MEQIKQILPLLLLCGGMVLAQQPETPSQPPPLSTPPTFPQGQGQSRPETMPPDTRVPTPQRPPAESESAQPTSIEGCLSSVGGSFIVTESSGSSVALRGDKAEFEKHLGEMVRVTGTPLGSTLGDQESRTPASEANALSVDSLKTVATTCTPSQSAPKR